MWARRRLGGALGGAAHVTRCRVRAFLGRVLGARAAVDVLAVTAVWLLGLIVASHSVLPRLVSPCGRLVHVPIGDRTLSQNGSQLAPSASASWRRIELEVDPRPGEAVSLVFSALGDRQQVFRMSRSGTLASGVLELDRGAVVSRRPLPWDDAQVNHAVRLCLEREAAGVRIRRCATPTSPAVTLDHASHDLQVVLFPPSSHHLHDRVHLAAVVDGDGREVPARRLHDRLTSPLTLLLTAVVAVRLGRARLRRFAVRRFPVHATQIPGGLAAFLFGTCLLLVVFALLCRTEQIRTFTTPERFTRRAFGVALVPVVFAFLALRERLVTRWPGLLRRRGWGGGWIPLQLVLFTVLSVVVLVAGFVRFGLQVQRLRDTDAASLAAPTRITVYGGSTTRGFPFPIDWRGTYPFLLEQALDPGRTGAVKVWNLAIDGGVLSQVEDMLPADLAELRPTSVVVDCVVNNAFGSTIRATRAELTRVGEICRRAHVPLWLVKEPTMEVVYGDGRWAQVGPYYALLDEVGRAGAAIVVDPNPSFSEHREEFLFMDEIHLAPRGHALLASILEDAVRSASADLGGHPAPSDGLPSRGAEAGSDLGPVVQQLEAVVQHDGAALEHHGGEYLPHVEERHRGP